jgi:hypothetical protein
VTHPHHARGIRRRLTPRLNHRTTSSSTPGTPGARSGAAASSEHSPVTATGSDQTAPAVQSRRGATRPAPTASAGTPAASDTSDTGLPDSGTGAPLLFTAEQAAALLQVRPSWLRRKAAARAVPCRFVGKHLRFSRADITAIAENSATPSQHSS